VPKKPLVGDSCFICSFFIFVQIVFFCDNSGSKYARSIKGSKDANDRRVFKKGLSQNNSSLDWRSGPDKVSKHALSVTSPRENSTPKSNNFLIETRRLIESVDSLNSSLAQSAIEL